MRHFVNLPITWIDNEQGWPEFFSRRGLNPELGFDGRSLELSRSWHRENAARLRDGGLVCSAHLPFFGPSPGQKDAQARRGGVEILKKAADIASIYEAAHLVGHPAYFAYSDSDGRGPAEGGIGPRPGERWLEDSRRGWEEVLAVTDADLYLENTHDTGPEAVLELIGAIARGRYHDQIGMCFDLGHWFSFAQGCDRRNLEDWLDRIAPRLAHLHLHDNAGHGDQHLGLGRGRIPLHEFFKSLLARRLAPGFTLEPHDAAALEHSLHWLHGDPVMGEWLEFAGRGRPV